MRYDYTNDNDISARTALDHEDRALDAILSRIDDAMNYLGDVPAAGRHFKYCD